MATKPLTEWTCDGCGGVVVAEEDAARGGYVNWDEGVAPIIVHKKTCQRDHLRASQPLSAFLGVDGLALLTAMLSYGALINHHRYATPADHPEFPLDGFVDFLRRVQLPYYEEARSKFQSRDTWDDYHDASELYPYLQQSLRDIAGIHEPARREA